jgi:hypothetical protein
MIGLRPGLQAFRATRRVQFWEDLPDLAETGRPYAMGDAGVRGQRLYVLTETGWALQPWAVGIPLQAVTDEVVAIGRYITSPGLKRQGVIT